VLLQSGMNISSFGEDEAGEIYVVGLGGTIARIVSTTPAPSPGPGACKYVISPVSAVVGSAGGTGSVSVSANAGCSWTAQSNVPWIQISAGASGTGDGAVAYSVQPLSARSGAQAGLMRSPSIRNGVITIAGEIFAIQQSR
jgi:hypothetical protein